MIALTPEAISTDCDQALRNAISKVFLYSKTLLCLWHANKNIQQYCKPKFTSKDTYESFFQVWLGIVRSRDISEYYSQLLQFSTEYSDTPEHAACVTYIKNTWLRPGRVESLVQAWTNNYIYFGITVTSRLVYIILYLSYINLNLVLKAYMLFLRVISLALKGIF
jgi:histone-lysine N-methyltransferase SETD2